MSLIKVVPYVLGVDPWVPGAPEPRMYPCSGYFLVYDKPKDPPGHSWLSCEWQEKKFPAMSSFPRVFALPKGPNKP